MGTSKQTIDMLNQPTEHAIVTCFSSRLYGILHLLACLRFVYIFTSNLEMQKQMNIAESELIPYKKLVPYNRYKYLVTKDTELISSFLVYRFWPNLYRQLDATCLDYWFSKFPTFYTFLKFSDFMFFRIFFSDFFYFLLCTF